MNIKIILLFIIFLLIIHINLFDQIIFSSSLISKNNSNF